MDVWLVGAYLALAAAAALNLYGIGGVEHALFRRELVLVGAGLAVMVLVSHMNYRYLKNWSVPVLLLWAIAVLLVASTLWFSEIRNIRAWIIIGGFQFEPSELMKLALVIVLAKYFSQRHVHISQFRHIAVSGLYAGIPAGLVLLQPDLGTAAIVGAVWLAMLIAAQVPLRHLFLIVAAGLVGAYLAWIFALAPYQKDRILAFMDPYADPSGYGYHIIQSQTAVGSGGLFGVGLGRGTQATIGYLPEPSSDFAFAAFAEQFGFVGAMTVMLLLAFLTLRVLRIGRASGNNFARLFCVGVAAVIWTHAFISASVNVGILPITGIPMTLLSYGGSHLLSISAALGVVQSIHRHG
jgi:rod shape determining protein RodA